MTAHALFVTHSESSYGVGDAYQQLRARTMAVEDDSPRNLRTDDAYSIDPLAGITLTAQADRDSGDAPTYSYGWRLGIDSDGTMPIANVAATLATLRRAEKKLDAMRASLGGPATFGAYCARLAAVLNIPIMLEVRQPDGPFGMYSTGEYNLWPAQGDAVSIIDGWTAEHRRTAVA